MNEEIKAVAQRLIGLRDIMDVSVEEAAGVCGVSIEQYQKYESGFVDIPVGILQSMAKKYGIDLGTLISGDEPRMKTYCLTKKDFLGEITSLCLILVDLFDLVCFLRSSVNVMSQAQSMSDSL